MALEGSKLGCLRWNSAVEREDFVFFCPYCSKRKGIAFPVCVVHSLICMELIIGL
jgi:hypothetical protein